MGALTPPPTDLLASATPEPAPADSKEVLQRLVQETISAEKMRHVVMQEVARAGSTARQDIRQIVHALVRQETRRLLKSDTVLEDIRGQVIQCLREVLMQQAVERVVHTLIAELRRK